LTVRASWLESREETRRQATARLPLAGAAWIYGAAARAHRGLHRAGVLRTARLPGHVVSVGSLVVGGTGKTPAAAWIAAELHRRGRKVALASRGHRGRSPERVLVVSDGRFVRSRAEVAGDEPMLLAAHAPGVPVLVGRDRALVGLRALSVFGAEVVVLDDGFQHHRLHRDLDVLTFDGAFGLGNRRVLPGGPLREPIGALRLADAVGVIDGPLADAETAPEVLEGAEVGMLAALARPGSLRRTLAGLGARVVAERCFRDHHRYRARDLRGLALEAPLWVTTEKDAVKITPAWTGSADLRVLTTALEIDEARSFADWIEARLS
jgi:tetraacyldisaccharide 4'-kinase